MQKRKVSIYGLTNEGFNLAKKIASNAEVSLIDEFLQIAINLNQDDFQASLGEILSEDRLLSFEPVGKTISKSEIVFFCPRIRKVGEESMSEVQQRIREMSMNIQEGCIVVNTVPTGPGGNSEFISLIEKQTGLKTGKNFSYCYFPLRAGKGWSDIFASTPGKEDILRELGLQVTSQNVFAAELEYIGEIMDFYLGYVSAIELNRKAIESNIKLRQKRYPYIDEMYSMLYDLRTVQAREDVSEVLAYLAGSIIKNIENFSRYLVESVKETIRKKGLKASRTKILLLWNVDKYEMRPDRLFYSESILQRLRDYVTDVSVVSTAGLSRGLDIIDSLKSNILVVCSETEKNEVEMFLRKRAEEMIVVHARPDLQTA